VRGGLTARTTLATVALTVIVGTSFAVLLVAVTDLRASIREAERAQQVLIVSYGLERLVVDLETGERGYLLTHDDEFLQPWNTARRNYSAQSTALRALVADQPAQEARVDRIIRSIASYVVDYSVPLVQSASAGVRPADLDVALRDGKVRLDQLRRQFDAFTSSQRTFVQAREEQAQTQGRRAVVAAVAGLVASLALVAFFTAYMRRTVVLPLLRAARMAGDVAAGNLDVRMPETDLGEIGALERSLNTMAASLADSRDGLQRLAGEQASLRRVATLVARGRPADEVFAAAAEETALVLHAAGSLILRLDADGASTIVARFGGERVEQLEIGRRFRFERPTATGTVFATGRAYRTDDPAEFAPPVKTAIPGLVSVVASPIYVEDRLWGAVAIGSDRVLFPEDTERRLTAFTELLGTAVANAENRSELINSRARIVAASDDTRRRIERDLHDGAQQRLVSLGLDLREIDHLMGFAPDEARRGIERVGVGIEEVLENLRETSRGIHPAILSQGGLPPALKALARRSKVPVELDVRFDNRLPEQVEVAAYYLVSEALTNAAKHSRADVVRVRAWLDDQTLEVVVSDDGVGGADPANGSGLVGLRDRAATLGGTIEFTSPLGEGTTISFRLPLAVPVTPVGSSAAPP
jgi:signal transduction histidine kinase